MIHISRPHNMAISCYAPVLIGRITGLARPSVRLSLPCGLLSWKQKRRRKTEIGERSLQ